MEIRELHIKVAVSDEERPEDTDTYTADNNARAEESQENLIRACVEQVLEILKEQKER